MNAGREKENFNVYEWSIDNFSLWNNEIHGEVISTKSSPAHHLFPRCPGGNGEYLMVRLYCGLYFSGDVSFISSDGTLLGTQKMASTRNSGSVDVNTGLKFEEVAAEIRKNRTFHKDRLTVRFRSKRPTNTVVFSRTIIQVHDAFFKISAKFVENLGPRAQCISSFLYYFDDDKVEQQMTLEASKNEFDKSKKYITFYVVPYSTMVKKNVLLLARTSLLNNEEVVRYEEDEQICQQCRTSTFSFSLKLEEMTNKFSLNLNLKLIAGIKYTTENSFHNVDPEVVAWVSPNSSRLPSKNHSKELLSKVSTDSNQTDNSPTMLAKELMSLYQDQDFSDFQLNCGTVSFPVHRAILSTRSPVFKTMLLSDMKEAGSGSMVIGDLDPSTLARFLIFLYTGTVEDLECDSALKLYYAADKYHVPTLKNKCVNFLCANVSISNVGDVLSLSLKHQDDRLRDVAHDFILKNNNEVLASEEWKIFLRSEPLIVAETLSSLFAKKK